MSQINRARRHMIPKRPLPSSESSKNNRVPFIPTLAKKLSANNIKFHLELQQYIIYFGWSHWLVKSNNIYLTNKLVNFGRTIGTQVSEAGTLTLSIQLRASGWKRGRGEGSRSGVSYSRRHSLAFLLTSSSDTPSLTRDCPDSISSQPTNQDSVNNMQIIIFVSLSILWFYIFCLS